MSQSDIARWHARGSNVAGKLPRYECKTSSSVASELVCDVERAASIRVLMPLISIQIYCQMNAVSQQTGCWGL